jgi:hypothetical protein
MAQEIVKNSNVNYLGRDFNDLKTSLINYAKSYFPNTYQDFNETSPGMMLLEMSAYVGDVLNFYVDQQYKEMMLPLAEERKNILTLAKAQGYKVNSISPAYVNLTIQTKVSALDNGNPNFADNRCVVIDKSMQVSSVTDSNLVFETLGVVDFKMSSSADTAPVVDSIDSTTGKPNEYLLERVVKAISGKTQTKTFDLGEPTKFKRLTLPETNVIEVLKVTDSTQNIWYEVGSLAQDKVPFEKHYSSDSDRSTAYTVPGSDVSIKMPVPYSLEFIKTGKRFITEINDTGQTVLIFGNGILKNGNTFSGGFLAIEQIGINLPGGEEDLVSEIDPLMGDAYGTLGQAPSNTTLTITYRIGGGASSNSPSNTITKLSEYEFIVGSDNSALSIINKQPASGGTSGETIEEIRHRTMGHLSTQQRCVSKEDYEARTLNLPAKFGNIAKVYCSRSGAVRTAQRKKIANLVDRLKSIIDKNFDMFDPGTEAGDKIAILGEIKLLLDADQSGGLNPEDFEILYEVLEMTFSNISDDDRLYTIDLYLMSYDNNKHLTATPNIIKQNLKAFLNEFRLLTDQVSFYDGYAVNFGVVFDVVGQSYDNKDQIKLRCIDAIKNHFQIDTMQFKQLIYTSNLENILMQVDGVRSVNYTTITQDFDFNAESAEEPVFSPGLFNTVINSDDTTSTLSNYGYGYYYDFSKFYGQKAVAGRGVVLPAYEPAVFELKNPNQNIRGIVR